MRLRERIRRLLGHNERPSQSRSIEYIGIDDATCQVNGRREDRSKMPIPQPCRQSPTVKKPHPQPGSLFFTRLPPEVRGLVYLQLFGNRRVHVEFDMDVRYCEKASRGTLSESWRWWHCICHEQVFRPSVVVHFTNRDECHALEWSLEASHEHEDAATQSWRRSVWRSHHKLSLEWLRCCRLG